MCGIAGILSFSGKPINPDAIGFMTETLKHRGPDGEGFFFDNGRTIAWTGPDGARRVEAHPWPAPASAAQIALGHRRLAILDLSPAGRQPMADSARRFWLVYNGEVYNYLELRRELSGLDVEFESDTDTEVVLESLANRGSDAVQRWNGMWALALWDARERRLLLSRDRFGVKPLYYLKDDEKLLFASEPKALSPFSGRTPDPGVAGAFLMAGAVEWDPARTFFKDIVRLPAGHQMVADRSGARSYRYWEPDVPDPELAPASFEEAADSFMELFGDSVRLRLRSDVPVGSCLSGGLDSSAIVSRIAGLRTEDEYENVTQHAVTAYYGGAWCDEIDVARRVASGLGFDVFQADVTALGLLGEVRDFVRHQDEPVYNLSKYSQWRVFKEASSRGLAVMLDGQGADELLGGYEPWEPYLMALIRAGKTGLAIREARALRARTGRNMAKLAGRMVFPRLGPVRNLYSRFVAGEAPASAYVKPEFLRAGDDFLNEASIDESTVDKLLWNQWHKTSLPALLRFEDRNAMAHSLEARLPYMDYRLMRFGFSLPVEYKLRDGWTKAVLREGARGLVPDEARLQKIKIAFAVPQKAWMLNGLRGLCREVLLDKQTLERGWFDRDALFASVSSDKFLASRLSWRLMNMEIWARLFLDEGHAAPGPLLD